MGCISSKRERDREEEAVPPPVPLNTGETQTKRSAGKQRHASTATIAATAASAAPLPPKCKETSPLPVRKASPEEGGVEPFEIEEEDKEMEMNGKKLKPCKSKGSNSSFSLTLRFGSAKNSQVVNEQAAAGWPGWLTAVAGEAIHGWIPLRADGFEKLEKVGNLTCSHPKHLLIFLSSKVLYLIQVYTVCYCFSLKALKA